MVALADSARAQLAEILARAAAYGWLGPGPVDAHVEHALAIAAAIRRLGGPGRGPIVDLGSGGGVPALVVAVALSPRPVTLLEGAARRAAFLRTASAELAGRAVLDVAEGRAEELAREPGREAHYGVVTARSFGRPAVTAECGARLLAAAGLLVVSEPPGASEPADRWDTAGLARLGLGPAATSVERGVRLAVMPKVGPTDPRFPRRVGVPAKRPLW